MRNRSIDANYEIERCDRCRCIGEALELTVLREVNHVIELVGERFEQTRINIATIRPLAARRATITDPDAGAAAHPLAPDFHHCRFGLQIWSALQLRFVV